MRGLEYGGATFEKYATPFGTTDQTTSEVRFATLTPTVACRFDDRPALGVSVNAGHSDVTFGFWPATSDYDDMGTPLDPGDQENGTLTLNQSALGLVKVEYDATVEGFT